jgi:hypothetical protein
MRNVRVVPSPRRPGALRSLRWLHRPPGDSDGWGTIEIRLGRRVTAYRCRAIPTDFGPEHCGFELHKVASAAKRRAWSTTSSLTWPAAGTAVIASGTRLTATASTVQPLRRCAVLLRGHAVPRGFEQPRWQGYLNFSR